MRRAFSPDERAEGPAVGGYRPRARPLSRTTQLLSPSFVWGLAGSCGPGVLSGLRVGPRVCEG